MFPGQASPGDSTLDVVQGNIQLQDANIDSTPEELNPLKEALERALLHKDEAAGIREALEAEVFWTSQCSGLICRHQRLSPTASDSCVISITHCAIADSQCIYLPSSSTINNTCVKALQCLQ